MTILSRSEPHTPAHLELSNGDVHIWHASLDSSASCVQKLEQTLSQSEHKRAVRFHFQRDKRRFVVGRGILRSLLGGYLNVRPDQVEFHYGVHGKPYISEKLDDGALCFNLAHSHELVVYAFACGRDIGVDLEYIRPIPDFERISANFFSERENIALNSLPVEQRQEGFFNCWTRKEAYIKALGDGLTHPLDQFHVSLIPGEPARLLGVEQAPEEVSRWRLQDFTPTPGYTAAIAVEGHDWQPQFWQWPDE